MKNQRVYSYVEKPTKKFIEKESKSLGMSQASYINYVIVKEMENGKKKRIYRKKLVDRSIHN